MNSDSESTLNYNTTRSEHELFDRILNGANLTVELVRLVRRDAGRNYGPGDTTGAAQSGLAGNVDVWHVLFGYEIMQGTL